MMASSTFFQSIKITPDGTPILRAAFRLQSSKKPETASFDKNSSYPPGMAGSPLTNQSKGKSQIRQLIVILPPPRKRLSKIPSPVALFADRKYPCSPHEL